MDRSKLPTAKWTRNNVTGFLTAVVLAGGTYLFDVDLSGYELEISLAVGWLTGAVGSYYVTETRPAPSSYPYLPAEVMPPKG